MALPEQWIHSYLFSYHYAAPSQAALPVRKEKHSSRAHQQKECQRYSLNSHSSPQIGPCRKKFCLVLKKQEDTASLISGAKQTEVNQDMPVHATITATLWCTGIR